MSQPVNTCSVEKYKVADKGNTQVKDLRIVLKQQYTGLFYHWLFKILTQRLYSKSISVLNISFQPPLITVLLQSLISRPLVDISD